MTRTADVIIHRLRQYVRPSAPDSVSIDGKVLEVTDHFTYLGSTITSNQSLDREIDKRIAKATGVLAKLSNRVWVNNQLS